MIIHYDFCFGLQKVQPSQTLQLLKSEEDIRLPFLDQWGVNLLANRKWELTMPPLMAIP